MSRTIVEIPEQNPIRFIEEKYPYPNDFAMYSNWFAEQLAQWDAPQSYKQRYTMADYIGVQVFHSLGYTSRILEIYDCNGLVATNIMPTTTGTLSGNIIQNAETGDVPYQLNTYNWQIAFNSYVANEGTYFLRLKFGYEVGETNVYDYYISEPILVQYQHPNTVLLEYISFSNKNDAHFKTPDMFFHLRVEGEIRENGMANNLTMYNDQKMNPRLQNAIPYRKFNLLAGHFGGIPFWMVDKIDRAFSNDLVIANKVRYCRDIDAQVETVNKFDRWRKYGISLAIREYDNSTAVTRVRALPFTVYTIPSYPYYAYEIKLRNSTTSYEVNVFSGFTVDDVNWHNIFVNNVLNGVYKEIAGLKGYFATVGNDVVYYNGAGEFFTDAANTKIFSNYTYLTASLPFFAPTMVLSADVTSGIGVSWRTNGGGDSNNYGAGIQTPTKTYTGGGNIFVRIFFDLIGGVLEGFSALTINNAYVNLIDGQYPQDMEYLEVSGTKITTFSFTNVYKDNLDTVVIKDNTLLTSITGFNKDWGALLNIDFSGNALSSGQVDNIFNTYETNVSTIPNGNTFTTAGQTPSAPPTVASAPSRLIIAGAGWTIVTD